MTYHTKAFAVYDEEDLTRYINHYVTNQPNNIEITIISINYINTDDDGVMMFYVTFRRK